MKYFIKNGAKVLFDYIVVLIIFGVFIYPFMSLTGDNFNTWLPIYCFIIFLFAFLIIYGDMNRLAEKEKKPQYDLHPYPMKGLVYGLIGIIPIALIVAVAAMITLENVAADRIRHLAINTFLGPMYFLIRWLNEAPIGYIAAILLLPLIAMLGYLTGYYGIHIINKLKKKKAVPEKGFTKSPWNPTNAPVKGPKKKKKKIQENTETK